MPGSQIQTILAKMPTLSLVKPVKTGRKNGRTRTSGSPAHVFPAARAPRMKTLAEAVILQAMEDLWSDTHREKSREFFEGDGFQYFADMAGMGAVERLRLIKMLGGVQSTGVNPAKKMMRVASF